MKIPRFWASVPHEVAGAKGRRISVKILGWSDKSTDDAAAHARTRARSITDLGRGPKDAFGYEYAGRPIREEIVEELEPGGELGLVTRNRYGALILNSGTVAFADIDVYPEHSPAHGAPKRHGFFAKLLRKPDPFDTTLARIRSWARNNQRYSMRLYRTCNGFRGMFTSGTFKANDPKTIRLLEELGSDPLYIKLCKDQECFRARLTAKPWRLRDLPLSYVRPPFDDPALRRAHDEWVARYDAARARYATCRFVEELNGTPRERSIRSLVEFHDRVTSASVDLPLA